jgi:hypothetical protein
MLNRLSLALVFLSGRDHVEPVGDDAPGMSCFAAAAREYDTPTSHYDFPVSLLAKGNAKIWNGTMVNTDANGYAVAAADVASHKCIGRANATCDTTAAGPQGVLADGIARVEALVGLCEYDNPAGANSLTQVDVGKLAYVLTDHEVARAAGTVNSIVAGRVVSVDVTRAKATIDHRLHTV